MSLSISESTQPPIPPDGLSPKDRDKVYNEWISEYVTPALEKTSELKKTPENTENSPNPQPPKPSSPCVVQ
jgi:hypothetical protein